MLNYTALFHQSFSYSPNGMAFVSLDGMWMKVNEAFTKISGYTEAELLSTSIQGITYRGDLVKEFNHIQDLVEGKKEFYQLEKRLIHKNGSLIWVLFSVFIVREGNKSLYFMAQIQDLTRVKQLEQKLKESEDQFRNLVTFSPNPIMVHNGETILFANKSAATLLCGPVDEIVGSYIQEFIDPSDLDYANTITNEVLNENHPFYDFDLKIRNRNGQTLESVLTAVPISFRGRKAIHVTYRDVTEQKRIEQALQESEVKSRALFEHANDAIFLFSLTEQRLPGQFIDVNQNACKLLGYTKEEFLNLSPLRITPEARWEKTPELMDKLLDSGHITFEGSYVSKGGREIAFEYSASVLCIEQETMILSIARDMTERKKAEKLLAQMAYFDYLTQLPNRRLFEKRLEHAIKKAHLMKGFITVMFLDLDGFKQINDTYGHQKGDTLLKEVAERLTGCVRKEDTVARHAGDEFTILLPDITRSEAITSAQRILDEFNAPIVLGEQPFYITPSIGISFYSEHSMDAKMVLNHADQAMYEVKEQGKNNYQIYDGSNQIKIRN
ncbi:bifunctional diguanylate cyclase/phosphodiesterase [Neobacillus niacini]|uniref:sensor domain-containing protein n=1 Tax=Neobacillus niacini TaxID=86668 RepID=UPI0021CB88EC|nr:PAS domain S-box protein [Neobacillus niacini]MCM3766075.1 PAS domain S-box protein [Neobacillus niacini]